MIQYGLISRCDANVLEKTIDLIIENLAREIFITEIGVYSGETGGGIRQYIKEKGKDVFLTGIDNNKDKETVRFQYDKFIIGNSNEVYNQIEDNSQHLIFEDSCHCFAHVVSTFFCYAPKVKVGGYFAFHDTGKHIEEFKDFQHGDKFNPDAYISVRNGLDALGMFGDGWKTPQGFYDVSTPRWKLIFDEADETNEAGGICVFKKLY